MTRMLVLAAAAALAAAGCGSSPASPSDAPVRVTVTQNPTFTADTLSFSLRLDNISPAAVDLTFPSSCQVLPYFVDRRTGQTVTPLGGGTACATVITRLTLVAGESFIQPVEVKAGTAPAPGFVVLPSGDYAIYARLEDQTYRLRSSQVPFTVR